MPTPMFSFGFLRSNGNLIGFGFALCFLSSVGQRDAPASRRARLPVSKGLRMVKWVPVTDHWYCIAGTLASAATLLWSGRVVDHWSVPRTAWVTLAGLAAVAAFMDFARQAVALAAAIHGLRLMGQGMATHIDITAMARYFVAERGRALVVRSDH